MSNTFWDGPFVLIGGVLTAGYVARQYGTPVGGTPTPTPPPSLAVTISGDGSPQVGELLAANETVTNGSIVARQWRVQPAGLPGIVNVPGATGATHTPADEGTYYCRSTASGAGGVVTVTSPGLVVAAAAGGGSPPTAPLMGPGPAWTGDANSPNAVTVDAASATGYTGAGAGTGYSTLPVDTSVAGRRASFRLETKEYQWFDGSDLPFSFMALVDGGFESVTVLCEGNEFPVGFSVRTYASDFDGSTKRLEGYHPILDHSAFPRDGSLDLYVRMVPNDKTRFDTTIVGPFRFERVSILHPHVYYVQPSLATEPAYTPTRRTYKTLSAALLRAGYNNNHHNAKIIISESAEVDIVGQGFNFANARGHLTVEAAPGVNVEIRRRGAQGSARMSCGAIHIKGPRIKVELWGYRGSFLGREAADRAHWASGVEFYSVNGRDDREFYSETATFSPNQVPAVQTHYNAGFVQDCYLHDAPWGFTGNLSLINCRVYNVGGDVTQYAWFMYNFECEEQDPMYYRTLRPAFTIKYDGAASTATMAKTGYNGQGVTNLGAGNETGTVQIVIGGTTTTIQLYNGAAPKTVAEVLVELNAIAGITATASADVDFWKAPHITKTGTIGFGGFTAFDIKAALQIYTAQDMHGDIVQQQPDGSIYIHIKSRRITSAQLFFASDKGFNDCWIVNYIGDTGEANFGLAQIGGDFVKNFNLAHITIVDQTFNVRTGSGAYVLENSQIKNSVLAKFLFGNAVASNFRVTNNHIVDSSQPVATETGTTTGGTVSSIFVNKAAGDYTPTGALAQPANLVAPMYPYDAYGKARQPLDAKGAVAL